MRNRTTWFVLAFLALVVGSGIFAAHDGRIFQKLYEHRRQQLANLQPLPGLGSGDLVITGVGLIDMTSERVQDNYTIVVRDGRIASIDPDGEIDLQAATMVIDGTNRYLIPGIADMHVHTGGIPLAYNLFLANGVTTIRETGGMPKYLEWARAVEAGDVLGPTIYTTGPTLRGRSMEEDGNAEPTTPDEIRNEIAEQYNSGFRSLKLYTYLSESTFYAAMGEAKRRGMYTVGHVPYSVGIDGVIEAGMDELAHIHSFHQDFFRNFDPQNVFAEYPIDEQKIAAIVEKVRASGTRVCVTMIVNQAMLDSQDTERYLQRPMMAYEMPWAKAYMRSSAWYFDKMWSARYLDETYLPWLYRLTKALHEAGVMLVLGTDSGVTGLVHGFSTQEELGLLVKAGLTPYEALLTGTRNAAVVSGDGDDWGTLEVGKRADMLLLDANPLDDIVNTQKIVGVVKAGRWLDREKLDQLLENVISSY